MRKYIITFLILLIASSAWGAKVNQPIVAHTSVTIDEAVLSIPRWHAGMSADGKNIILAPGNASGDDYLFVYSTDYGASFDTVYSDNGIDGGEGTSGHCHFYFHNDTLYVGGVDDSGYPFTRYIAYPWTSASDMSAFVDIDSEYPTTPVQTRTTVVANDDSSWVITRNTTDDDALRIYVSDDHFVSDTTYQVVDLNSGDSRIGAFLDYDNEIPIILVLEESQYFKYLKWNGSVFANPVDSLISDDTADNTRAMTGNFCDGRVHLIRSGGNGSNQQLIHWVQDATDSSGWETPDTISTSTVFADGNGYFPVSSVKGDSLFLFYACAADAEIYCYKMWTPSGWTADSVVITDTTTVDQYLNTVPYVPAGVNYIPFYWVTDENVFWYNSIMLADTLIYSVPFTVTTAMNDETIRLAGTSLSATNGAIIINNNVTGVTLQLETDTLIYNTGNNTNARGIYFGGSGCNNITINGGYLIDGSTQDTTHAAMYNTEAIRLPRGIDSITIENVHFIPKAFGGQAIVNEDASYNLLIKDCIIYDSVLAFRDRQQWIENARIALGNNNDGANGYDYHVRVTGCSLFTNWVGLYIHGDSTVAQVDSNYLVIDARNDWDTTTGSGILGSAAQCYNMSLKGDSGGVRINIYDNYLTSGTNHAGGRGLFMSSLDGYAEDSIYFHDNTINIHQGWDGEDETLNGILLRQGVSNALIYNNIIIAVGDTGSGLGTSYAGGPISGLRVGSEIDNVTIRKNDVQTYMTGNWTPDYAIDAMHAAGIIFDQMEQDEPGIVIDSNTFTSNSINIRWGFLNGHGGNVTQFNNEYAEIDTGNQGLAYVFYKDYAANTSLHSYNNFIIDANITGTPSIDTILCGDNGTDSLSLTLQAIYILTVNDSTDSPLASASVWFVDVYGDTMSSGTTNGSGIYSDTITYRSKYNDEFSFSDSSYNNFTIGTAYSGDTTTAVTEIYGTNKDTTLTINALAGESASGKLTPIYR